MKKVTVLFGAGAEGNGQIGLPSGAKFKQDVILSKDVKMFSNCFLQSAKSRIELKNGPIIIHNSSSVLYQTIVERLAFDSDVLAKLFPDSDKQDIAREYLKYKSDKDESARENISDEFMELYREDFYKKIKDSEKGKFSEPVDYFLKHVSAYSFLDSLFNYLRKPELYKNECARVIKVYYAALISILNGLVKNTNVEEYEEYEESLKKLLNGSVTGKDAITSLSSLIDDSQNSICKRIEDLSEDEKNKIYYYNIKKIKDKSKKEKLDINISCVTTNYTDIAERITEIRRDKIAYLHGKLNLFEELETKKIVDIKEINLEKTIFPYLLVQSGVKPIISPYQIKEFHKACDMILNADELLIIGYGVNSDDEHITNILRERLAKDKEIKYFVHCESKDEFEKKKKEVNKQLDHSPLIKYHCTDEFNDVIEGLCSSCKGEIKK